MFESMGQFDFLSLYRYYKLARKRIKRGFNWRSWFSRLLALAMVAYYISLFDRIVWTPTLIVLNIICLLILLYTFFPVFFGALKFSLFTPKADREDHTTYQYDRIHNECQELWEEYYYSDFVEIVVVRNAMYLFISDVRAVIQTERNLTRGRLDDLADFLSEKTGLPVRRFQSVAAYRKE